jgi:hypothetical protein
MQAMRSFWIAAALAVLTPIPAWAHALRADYSIKDGTIQLEAYFDDDSPARNAQVLLQDDNQKTLTEGNTDAMGVCSLPTPPPGRYFLIVDAGMGHRYKQPIVIADEKVAQKTSVSATENTRKEHTGFPFFKVSLGFGIIFLASLTYLIAKKLIRFIV